jgi:hypothetical protein
MGLVELGKDFAAFISRTASPYPRKSGWSRSQSRGAALRHVEGDAMLCAYRRRCRYVVGDGYIYIYIYIWGEVVRSFREENAPETEILIT